MPCFHPLHGYFDKIGRQMYFSRLPDRVLERVAIYPDSVEELSVPCGKCIGCRLERSRQWAMRCVHEASLYDDNCFVTLTYDDEHLPKEETLVKRDLQLFFKRLRKEFANIKIRYFAAGEYGDLTFRPHYHIIFFGFSPPDFDCGREDLNIDPLVLEQSWHLLQRCYHSYSSFSSFGSSLDSCVSSARSSGVLKSIWKMGNVMVGKVTFESCAYVARYCLKKVNGDAADEHYHGREPEFVLMSRRPGIGLRWLEKYGQEVLDSDTIIVRGHFCKPPRYYDNQLEKVDFFAVARNKDERKERAKERESSQERLDAMEEVTKLRQAKKDKKL